MSKHLTATGRHRLLQLLKKFEYLFDGTLVTWNTTPLELELKNYVKPVCLRPYPVPKVHKTMFKKEVKRLVSLVVLEEANDSEKGETYFAQPKSENESCHILKLFSELK